MRLSTMTNLFYRETPDRRNYIECIRRTHKIGFKVIDLNTCPLKQINYSGDFNFELSCYRRTPEALREPLVRYIYEVGTYLVGLYDKA